MQGLDLSHPGASQAHLVQVVRALAGAKHATPRLPAIADALAAAARGGLAPWPPRRAATLLHAFALLNFPPSRLLAASSEFPPSRLLASCEAGSGDRGEGAQRLCDEALGVRASQVDAAAVRLAGKPK